MMFIYYLINAILTNKRLVILYNYLLGQGENIYILNKIYTIVIFNFDNSLFFF
jgi:hypothetical protein